MPWPEGCRFSGRCQYLESCEGTLNDKAAGPERTYRCRLEEGKLRALYREREGENA
jgi:hypothetical protein